MIYGYARVSSTGQDLTRQVAQLLAAGCVKVHQEKASAASAERPKLKRAIGALDAGDVLMVTATDRLARNTRDLLNILHAVKEAGAGFRSIAEPMVDTTSQFAEGAPADHRAHQRGPSPGEGARGLVRATFCAYPPSAKRRATAARSQSYAADRCCPARGGSRDDIATVPKAGLNDAYSWTIDRQLSFRVGWKVDGVSQ